MARMLPWVMAMAVLGGCMTITPRFSRQRYDTLYTGMPDYEVRHILGKPRYEGPDQWEYEHSKPYYRAVIYFRNGVVARRQWFNDPPKATLPATAPASTPVSQPQDAPEPAPAPGTLRDVPSS